MKTLYLLVTLITMTFITQHIQAQNLVPNPSFENYTSCPNGPAQLSYTGNWTFVGASTDFYNACSPQGNMSVPSNIYGYQDGYDSNGYIGMITYAVGDYQDESTYREPAGTYLTQPLIIGQKYYLSFKAALTINNFESGGACNKLGAKLSTVAYSNSNPAPVDNFAQVYTDSIITDSVNWTTISGSFIADSAYSFISIGNFFDSTNIQYIDFNGLWYTESAYYYIDDVRLSTDSNFVLSVNQKNNINLTPFSIYPNPATNFVNIIFEDNKVHTVVIYNSVGEVVLTKSVTQQSSINTSSLAQGIYYIQTSTNNNFISKKLIIY
jgi:type IX secretion system substrate protein